MTGEARQALLVFLNRKSTYDAINANTKVDYKTGQIYNEIGQKWVDPSKAELGHRPNYEF